MPASWPSTGCVYEDFLSDQKVELYIERKQFQQCIKVLSLNRFSLVGDVIVYKRIEESYSDLLSFVIWTNIFSGWRWFMSLDYRAEFRKKYVVYKYWKEGFQRNP
jgi:hypothetical protein